MSYLTFNRLSSQTFQKSEALNESKRFSISSDKVVFLSYRRKDKLWVKPIVDLLQSLGVRVYIDYLDDQLPDTPSSSTAKILRRKIKDSDKFILLATPNSKDSKWIPWELGLGDGFDGYENTVILPLTDSSLRWDEQEYFGIYGYVKEANSKDNSITDWAIFYPDGTAIWLKNWLRNS